METDNAFKICKVSMCPPERKTVLENMPVFNSRSHFIIEFGSNDLQLLVSVGQKIENEQIIAYINGIPVKSKVLGKITEVNEKYIIGDYITDTNAINIDNGLINGDVSSQFDEINDIMNKNQQITSFIKDYILRFKFADFATNIVSDPKLAHTTTKEISEKYTIDADKINQDYTNEIKRICDKDHIKTECENNNLLGIKKELENERIAAFNKIFHQYNNTEAYGKTSGKISDYMLYDLYMEYLTSDKFIYDDDNPYVVQLFTYITEFLKLRSKIELNCTNIEGLIVNFNDMCKETLKKYWAGNYQDYYSRMKSLFKYDFYTDIKTSDKAKINDKGRITLYSKVLDYLKNLTKYQAPVSAEEKYKGYDTETLMNMETTSSSEEEDSNTLLNRLKKISISFVILRKLEVDHTKENYYTKYISKEDLTDIFSIKTLLGDKLNEYYIGTTDSELLAYDEPLKKYMGTLKGITDDESQKLKSICDDAISWYIQNHEKIDSGSIFDKYKEVSWPSVTTIKKENENCDFFYIEEPKTNEEIIDEMNNTEDFPEDSFRTKFGVDSYGYWLKYFTIATLMNCLLPMFWSTGVPPPIGPTPFPIIFIPIVVIPGRVTIVIGLAICGICPLPMIYFVNMSNTAGCIIPPVNSIIDTLKSMTGKTLDLGMMPIKNTLGGLVELNDTAINETNKRIEQIDKDIYNLKIGVEEDKETLRALKKRLNLDPTTHKSSIKKKIKIKRES